LYKNSLRNQILTANTLHLSYLKAMILFPNVLKGILAADGCVMTLLISMLSVVNRKRNILCVAAAV